LDKRTRLNGNRLRGTQQGLSIQLLLLPWVLLPCCDGWTLWTESLGERREKRKCLSGFYNMSWGVLLSTTSDERRILILWLTSGKKEGWETGGQESIRGIWLPLCLPLRCCVLGPDSNHLLFVITEVLLELNFILLLDIDNLTFTFIIKEKLA
jgi:hypothetical protein